MASRSAVLVGMAFACAASAVVPAAASAADSIYWGNDGPNTISFARLDGSGGGDLNTKGATVSLPAGVALDPAAGRIYWANFGGGLVGAPLSFANLDGSGGNELKVGEASATTPNGAAIDPTTKTIYWANFSRLFQPPVLSFAKLDSANPEGEGGDLNLEGATIDHPNGVAVDPVRKLIYWTNAGTGDAGQAISVAHLDTGKAEDIRIDGANHELPRGLAVDPNAGLVYWTNFTGNKISFARLDGGGGGDLPIPAADVEKPLGLAIDHAAGRIYWTNFGDGAVDGSGSIFTAKLDGSDAHEIKARGASIGNPTTPNLLVAPRPTASPAVSGGSAVGSVLSCSQGAWAADIPVSFLYEAPQSFAFQWTRNGRDVSGAKQSSFTVRTAGTYRCRVAAQNLAGSTANTSAPHAVPDVTAPSLTSVSLTHSRFRIGKAPTPVKGRVKAAPRGTVLRFTSSEAGRLSILIEAARPGHKVGKTCKPVAHATKRGHCTAFKRRATLLRTIKAGKGSVKLSGRVGKKAMAPGRYRLTVTVRDAAGNLSKPARRPFTIVTG